MKFYYIIFLIQDEINNLNANLHSLESRTATLKSENDDLKKMNEELKKPSPIATHVIDSLQAQLLTLQSKYNSLIEKETAQPTLKIDPNASRIVPFKNISKSESTKSLKGPSLEFTSPKSQYADLNITSPKFLSPFEDFGYASPLPVIRSSSPVEISRLEIIKLVLYIIFNIFKCRILKDSRIFLRS